MLANFVQESANNPGTSATVTLTGAGTGRRTFVSSFANGSSVYYFLDDGTQSEWGSGVISHGPPATLSRTTVISNTSGTSARLNFSGVVRVYCALPAERYVFTDSTGALQGTTVAALRAAIGATTTGSAVLAAVDQAAARTAIGAFSSTMNTARLLGRTTASSGAVEEISVGAGLSLSGGALSATAQIRNQVFSSSGTFTVPTGVTQIKVTCVGGGGGGAAGAQFFDPENGAFDVSGGSGGPGGVAVSIFSVTPGQSITVTVGTGGAGSNTGNGGNGGTTSFGSFLSATGGSGGIAASTSGANGAAGVPSAQHMWGPSFVGVVGFRLSGGTSAVSAVVTGSGILVGAAGRGETAEASNNAVGGSGGAVFVEWVA